MAQTFSVDFINVQVVKNTSADKKILDKVWSALSWAKNDSKKVHSYLFKHMAQVLPTNRLWLCETQDSRADKKIQDLNKSVDQKITARGTISYPMTKKLIIYKIILLIWAVIKAHWLTENSGTNSGLNSPFLSMAVPKYVW